MGTTRPVRWDRPALGATLALLAVLAPPCLLRVWLDRASVRLDERIIWSRASGIVTAVAWSRGVDGDVHLGTQGGQVLRLTRTSGGDGATIMEPPRGPVIALAPYPEGERGAADVSVEDDVSPSGRPGRRFRGPDDVTAAGLLAVLDDGTIIVGRGSSLSDPKVEGAEIAADRLVAADPGQQRLRVFGWQYPPATQSGLGSLGRLTVVPEVRDVRCLVALHGVNAAVAGTGSGDVILLVPAGPPLPGQAGAARPAGGGGSAVGVGGGGPGMEITRLRRHSSTVRAMTAAMDPRPFAAAFATASEDGEIRVWATEPGPLPYGFREVGVTADAGVPPAGTNGRLRLSADGSALMLHEPNGRIHVARLVDDSGAPLEKPVLLPVIPDGTYVSADLDADGQRVVVGTAEGIVKVVPSPWRATRPDPFDLPGHGAPVHMISVSPDGRHLVSASLDGRVYLTELALAERLARLPFANLQPAGLTRETLPPRLGGSRGGAR